MSQNDRPIPPIRSSRNGHNSSSENPGALPTPEQLAKPQSINDKDSELLNPFATPIFFQDDDDAYKYCDNNEEKLNDLYDLKNAPPPNSRRYQEYQARRKRDLRTVALTSGNLVLDCPVPSKVLEKALFTQGEEFTHMRYTAATCDPDDFLEERFTLRPALFGRQTELFIVMTMYNEDENLFVKTMRAVMKNVTHLCSRNRSRIWGDQGWEKVVVCIVADGRTKVHPRTLKVLAAMGVYQDNIAQTSVNGKPVTAHIYEYTSQIMMDNDLSVRSSQGETVPIQVIFCLKEKNAKKLNSHRWFFNAFGPVLSPNVCVLIDVGTKPTPTSIYHLWKAFDRNPDLGGACGEIYAELGNNWKNLRNPLVAAQNFEYKMSNILDKPLESAFGYISVLPGAFSAYRYAALQNTRPGVGPLASYFRGELMHGDDSKSSIFEANMYLAEDRILCFELVAKKDCKWVLKYVKSAAAETDVPDTLPELISQRRRWLNGSFFAAFFAICHFYQILKTSHSTIRKGLLLFEYFYNFINMIFSWFALANYYLTFYFLGNSASIAKEGEARPLGSAGPVIFTITRYLYIISIMVIFILSLGNRPQGYKTAYTIVVIFFAIIMIFVTYLAFHTVFSSLSQIESGSFFSHMKESGPFRDIVISTISTYGLYLIASIMFLDPWHMFSSLIQYLLIVPAFVNILMVYAFCNTHDVSWGTKGDSGGAAVGGHVQSTTNAQGVEIVNVEVNTDQAILNAEYEKNLNELVNPPPEFVSRIDPRTKREDSNKQFRTRIVIAWVLSNTSLIAIFTSDRLAAIFNKTSDATSGVNSYLAFLFWSVAIIAFIRFLGASSYLAGRLIWG